MKITLTSVLVDDQAKALDFYTRVLGFQKKYEVPMGEFAWLTVVSPDAPDGVELLLEPDQHPAARTFKDALVADGIPFTAFTVDDVEAEHAGVEVQRLGLVVDEHARQGDPHGPVLSSGRTHRSRSGARGVVSRWWKV